MRKLKLFLLLSAMLSVHCLFSQSSTEKVKVFLDCTRSWLCDFDYVRTEMKMVEFVRDRFQSDVHVLVNTQYSSSGGEQNQVNFLGLQRFSGINDTLTYYNDPTAQNDEKRKQLVHYLELGLMRYIAKTNAAKDIQISYTRDTASGKQAGETKKDAWNYWVFQFGTSGNFSGNQNYHSNSWYGYINADKETEEWKTNIYLSVEKNNQVFRDITGESKFETKNYNSGVLIAKSINQHWSYGLSVSYENSLYRNIKAGYTLKPRLEYSIFPYSKFNSQRIVFQYMLGPVYNNYYDTSLYFKTSEWQIQHYVTVLTSFTKPWGSVNIGIFWSNYFDHLSKNNLAFNGAISWKIVKGLNFGIYGNYSLVHDQIGLRKGEATRDQILIRNRELLSSYDYGFGLGFSYRFGSISNSIINPRFKGLSYSINF